MNEGHRGLLLAASSHNSDSRVLVEQVRGEDFVMAIKKDGAKQKTKPASGKTEESPTTKQVRKPTSPSQKRETDFPIVGIGSSAGGLEALQELFTHMP